LESSRELVQDLIRRLFPGQPEARVLEILDRYGTEPYERERDRVQVAVLKLSDGDLERLAEMVTLAKTDFRDVLAAAEYPGELAGRLEPPAAEMERVRQQDRQQYQDWVRRNST
jgi:hypothetical protein